MIAGDFMADYIQANGTFNDYIQFGTKRITSTNIVVDALWLACTEPFTWLILFWSDCPT